jgi:hypothetical protein
MIRTAVLAIAVSWAVLVGGASSAVAQPTYKTTVAPLPGENLAGPCSYDMTLPAGKRTVRAAWVTFDRGRDIMKYYSDPDVHAFARRHDLALVMPRQCTAKSAPGDDMDMDPSHGIGRALFTALEQFAKQSGHPELASTKLILLGFSGTGALFAHFAGFAPDRVVAVVPTNPGHFNPVNIDNVQLSPVALRIPQFVMAGGADRVCGTRRPYEYFRRYYDQDAPWAFLVQNETPHCCIINTKSLMLGWLEAVIRQRRPSHDKPLRMMQRHGGRSLAIRTCDTELRDGSGAPTWNVCDARVLRPGESPPKGMIAAGWLPSSRLADEWRAFITKPSHDTSSVP